jgi:hypothetical protein
MIFVLPVSLSAQDIGRAMLRTQGGTWLNGNAAPESTAIFPDDLVQTDASHVAKIEAEGSTVTVQPESIVQFHSDELVLDHGSLQIGTSRKMQVRVNCLTVIPVIYEWTLYDVTDLNGKVTVVAHKKDVNIHAQSALAHRSKQSGTSGEVTVHETETATRDDHCPAAGRLPGSIDATGPWLDNWWVRGIGMAGVGAVLCKAFCFSGGDKPVSPSVP